MKHHQDEQLVTSKAYNHQKKMCCRNNSTRHRALYDILIIIFLLHVLPFLERTSRFGNMLNNRTVMVRKEGRGSSWCALGGVRLLDGHASNASGQYKILEHVYLLAKVFHLSV
jgi:hypothetical protein